MTNQSNRTLASLVGCCIALLLVDVARSQEAAPGRLSVDAIGGVSRLVVDGGSVVRETPSAITGERMIEVPGSDTQVVLWYEEDEGGSSPYYTISLDGETFSRPRRTSYELKLRHGEFDPVVEGQVQPLPLQQAVGVDNELYVVQFESQPLSAFREAIGALGGRVYSYLANHAHIVRMSPEVKAEVESLPYVRWVGSYHAAYRLEEPLLAALRGEAEPLSTRRYRVQVFESGPAQKELVADRITGMGGTIDVLSPGGPLLEATLTSDQLQRVAGMNEVLFVDRWSPPRARMNVVRAVSGANYVETFGGFTGAGVRGEVMDGGCDTDHQDFVGHIQVRGNEVDQTDTHGTATFGINFGNGTGTSSARGVLPDAFGYFNDFALQTTRYDDIGQLVTPPFNCVFQSNSWGFTDTTEYTTVTAEMDQAVFDFDIVVLHSMGNTGTQSAVEHAWGKNVVGVGGIVHFGTVSKTDDVWGGSGSIGPAADGRIKPDLCHFFDEIFTTTTGGGYTSSFGGTSAACPITAGHFGLFFQMWADGIFGNPVDPSGTVFSERPHASTAKAAMINSASQYSFSGTGADKTRTHQGWGLPDVKNLYDRRDETFVVNEDDVLQQLEVARYARTINAGANALRVTMVYTDKEGTTSSSQHRINALTLKVISPSGTAYHGNNGLLSGVWSSSGGSPNLIDNVENVFVFFPEPGNWKIEVTADEVNADGHVETPEDDVDFALVITGGTDCPFPVFSSQPQSEFPCLGDDVVLSAAATDFTSLQWYKDDVMLVGETGLTLTISDFSVADEGVYELIAGNACGETTSAAATVQYAGTPTITQQPVPPSPRCEGDDIFLTVEADGIGPFSYQWYLNGVPIDGETSSSLLVSPATALDAGDYFCDVSNECNTVSSDTVAVAIEALPEFTTQPLDTCAEIGETIVLTAEATASSAFLIQWRKGETVVGTGETLTLADLEAADAGDYFALAFTFDPICISTSETATVTVGDCLACVTPGDMDGDGDQDLADAGLFVLCFGLPATTPGCACANVDDTDEIIDASDWTAFAPLLSASGPQ